MPTSTSIRLYGFSLSGHSHRVQLFLSLLDLPYQFIAVDLPAKEQKTPAFLTLNPRGQVPVIIDGDVTLYDSTAILVYLAKRYGTRDGQPDWLPQDALAAAQVQQFLSLASGEILAGPARARMVMLFQAPFDHAQTKELAQTLLHWLDAHLEKCHFLVGAAPTIADLACYSYVAHVPEGGVSLAAYTHVRNWLSRIESLPRFLAMPASPHAA